MNKIVSGWKPGFHPLFLSHFHILHEKKDSFCCSEAWGSRKEQIGKCSVFLICYYDMPFMFH